MKADEPEQGTQGGTLVTLEILAFCVCILYTWSNLVLFVCFVCFLKHKCVSRRMFL